MMVDGVASWAPPMRHPAKPCGRGPTNDHLMRDEATPTFGVPAGGHVMRKEETPIFGVLARGHVMRGAATRAERRPTGGRALPEPTEAA